MEFLLELLLFGIWYFGTQFLKYYYLECNVVSSGQETRREPCTKPA